MNNIDLKEGERAIITSINGEMEFQNFLLANGLTLGTMFTKNYSPSFSKLINLTIGNKMLSLKQSDFNAIEFVKI